MLRHGNPTVAKDGYSVEPKEQGSCSPENGPSRSNNPLHEHKRRLSSRKVWDGTIHPDGDAGRRWFHPFHFFHVIGRSSSNVSMAVNILWPIVPAAIAVHFALPSHHLVIFILNYIAIVPSANLIGFAGQDLARKLPRVLGVVLETTLGSLVEIVLFTVLVTRGQIGVVRSAILGSILANLLLCLGLCFIAGNIRMQEQVFHEAVSEQSSGLLLVAGFGLIITTAYSTVVGGANGNTVNDEGVLLNAELERRVLAISRASAVLLLLAFFVYTFFQTHTHHGIYDELLEADEENDNDRERDLARKKLTFTECIIALVFALACVTLCVIFLVLQIDNIVNERGVTEAFMGLILVPLVEKAAEHLTAIDEAWDNQANFALIHVLGSSIQTALLNTPIVVIVGWGLGKDMDLNFSEFEAIMLILAIIVVGNFLRDGKSSYLEGVGCVLVYAMIAVSAFYYPNANDPVFDNIAGVGTQSPAQSSAAGETSGGITARAVATATSILKDVL